MVEYNSTEEKTLQWAKHSENLATWNVIAHFKPLLNTIRDQTIKHFLVRASLVSVRGMFHLVSFVYSGKHARFEIYYLIEKRISFLAFNTHYFFPY